MALPPRSQILVTPLERGKFQQPQLSHWGSPASGSVGIPEATIKILVPWESQAYQQYIRPSPGDLVQVPKQMCEP